MANLVFSDLENEVYAHTGLDSSDSTISTNVDRWLNYVQQDLCARWPWPFMESRENIVTVKDKSAGTVVATNNSTAVTGTSTSFASSDVGSYIQFSSANDWYKITAVGGATSLTIETAYAQTTGSALTYIIRKFLYSLSSSADRVIDIRNWNTPMKLVQVDARTLDGFMPNPQSTNSSYGYLMWGVDSSQNIQVSPYPFPSDARLLELRTIKRPTDGTISIPNKYAHIIAWGATSVGFAFLRKLDIASQWNAKFESRISEMKTEYRMSEDYQSVFRSIDSVQRTKWLPLPDQYPSITT